MAVSKNWGPLFGSPSNKSPTFLGIYIGTPDFWNPPYRLFKVSGLGRGPSQELRPGGAHLRFVEGRTWRHGERESAYS